MKDGIIKLIPIYIMGKRYEVPNGLTIQKALEYSGYKLTRGCGCRGGVCGACATIYRRKGEFRLNVGLACQTVVEPEIYLVQLPYTPANKALYTLKDLPPDDLNIALIYPELLRCMGCNTCTKSCPMNLEVMNYISATIRGDFKAVVELSIECVQCGLCAARCPAELAPFNIALLIRRLYGRHIVGESPQLKQRLEEIRAGKYKEKIDKLMKMDKSEVENIYKELQATKGAAV
ncbi:MAG: 4Fe-4S dicluster domain-containing protein [Deltaproteobacteria bacterium]|nr:4Fe-4S dicluster domain-containing protein [Deltaproteobacteria bacterium]MBW1961071.1 4Fe-4S dicluster domain-containing protein [Deltaproteobacteria bacterium]MBW2150512.1 4Fe-4S dicluster domain-containing protein [Deltaproteobacteria bacterium]